MDSNFPVPMWTTLDFQNHCFLCLKPVEDLELEMISGQNPKQLDDFQPILQYLTGQLYSSSKVDTETVFFPVCKQVPPLCKICYDILETLSKFHGELLELQKNIQSQIIRAREVVLKTQQIPDGTLTHFLNQVQGQQQNVQNNGAEMKKFLGKFHDRVNSGKQDFVHLYEICNFNVKNNSRFVFEAVNQRKAEAFPEMLPLTFNEQTDAKWLTWAGFSPYFVEFVEPKTKGSTESLELSMDTEPQILSQASMQIIETNMEDVTEENNLLPEASGSVRKGNELQAEKSGDIISIKVPTGKKLVITLVENQKPGTSSGLAYSQYQAVGHGVNTQNALEGTQRNFELPIDGPETAAEFSKDGKQFKDQSTSTEDFRIHNGKPN